MQSHRGTTLVALLLAGTTGGCATKGYVNTTLDDRTRQVERRVDEVERTLDDTVAATARNAARIGETDQTATTALDTAESATRSAVSAQATATAAGDRVRTLEAAHRRLLFEVVLAADHGPFGFGDAALPSGAVPALDGIVERVRSHPASTFIEIEGHTDGTGAPEFNTRLGLARAEAVRRYLHEQHRLPLHKIGLISYGEEKPVAPNDTVEGRARNRRVVVRVLG